ncbi:MAG: SDR family NAD(P)-dependent oxidoreductase [Gammaproteobacteria bacterium]
MAIDTLIWISGGSAGLGAGLVATVPYSGARIINLSRRAVPGVENILLDLCEPTHWERAARSFAQELAAFTGTRAIFIHNAFYGSPYGWMGTLEDAELLRSMNANAVAPVMLGNAFVRACRPDIDCGLVLLSSAGAKIPFPGAAWYSAAKAGVEMWVRTVAEERKRVGDRPWVLGVRPGTVDTPGLRHAATLSDDVFPAGAASADAVALGESESAEVAARRIWKAIEDRTPSGTILKFGQPPSTLGKH